VRRRPEAHQRANAQPYGIIEWTNDKDDTLGLLVGHRAHRSSVD
jgi:hypothetical protein